MEHEPGDENDEGGKSLPDTLKKALISGLSAVLVTEEGIRGALSDMRLPKDAMAYLLQQTATSRRELLRLVTEEAKGLLKTVDLKGEIRKALSGMKLEVKAEIRFVDEAAGRGDKAPARAEQGEGANDDDDSPARPPKRRRP